MTDPISAGGSGAVRFALSTVPPLVTTPLALALPAGVWLGNAGAGVSTGFTLAIILPMIVEYMRRGSISAAKPTTRNTLLELVGTIYGAAPVLSLAGLILGIVALANCFGRTCSTTDHVVAVMGCVFAVIAIAANIMLVRLLRSPLWAQYRAASAGGAK